MSVLTNDDNIGKSFWILLVEHPWIIFSLVVFIGIVGYSWLKLFLSYLTIRLCRKLRVSVEDGRPVDQIRSDDANSAGSDSDGTTKD